MSVALGGVRRCSCSTVYPAPRPSWPKARLVWPPVSESPISSIYPPPLVRGWIHRATANSATVLDAAPAWTIPPKDHTVWYGTPPASTVCPPAYAATPPAGVNTPPKCWRSWAGTGPASPPCSKAAAATARWTRLSRPRRPLSACPDRCCRPPGLKSWRST